MANAISQMVALTAITPTLISANAKSKPSPPSLDFNRSSSEPSIYAKPSSLHIPRRIVAWGLAGAVLGLSVGDEHALAAKRAPAAPTQEKKDQNVSGVQAKVLASKRRKEAMKEAMAKQRERGKPINK